MFDMSSYPQGVSLQRPHHGQEERLLEQSEQSADQGLHASQAAKLRGRVPEQDKQHVTDVNNSCEQYTGLSSHASVELNSSIHPSEILR